MVVGGRRPAHPPSGGIRRHLRRLPRGTGVAQLALLLALLVPLLPGTWAFSELAARRETTRVDTHLQTSLGASLDEYRAVLNEAQERARTAANAVPVQRAFIHRDRRALRRLERRYPGVQLLLPDERTPVADALPGPDVVDNGRRVGRVVAPVYLRGEVLARMRHAAQTGSGERMVILRGDVSIPANRPSYAQLGGVEYRMVATTLRQQAPRIRLVVLRDRDDVRAAVDAARRRTVIVAVFALVAVSVLAYLFAPALARTRLRRRQRLQADRLLNLLSDGVLEVDENGLVSFVNPAAEAMLGYDADDLLDRPAADALPSHLLPEAPSDVRVDADARERWLAVASAEAEGGRIYTYRDVTRERRLEEMRTDLIATVSHELRTPLAAVYGAAMTLQRTPQLDGRMHEQLVTIIGNQAERLARIVDDILTASRAAGDRRAAARAVRRRRGRRGRRERRGRAHRPPDHPRRGRRPAAGVRVNPEGLRRVLDNLVDNAIKYAPERLRSPCTSATGARRSRSRSPTRGPGSRAMSRSGSSSASTGSTRRWRAASAARGSASTSRGGSSSRWAAGSSSAPSPATAPRSRPSFPRA